MYNLDKQIETELISLAKNCGLSRVILFGSRSRGDNDIRSDIDLAVVGDGAMNFIRDVNSRVFTLLKIDVVDITKRCNPALQRELNRDGVVIYEKTR